MWLAYATCCRNFHSTKKLEINSKQKVHQIDEQNIEDIDHIDDDRANSEESVSVLRWSSGANIDHSVYLVFEKDKLNYSQYISLKHENLILCELSSSEVSLKRAMMDNLELDDSSLVAGAKKLKIMISDKNAHSTDVFYRQRCYNEFPRDYKPAESNREDKYSI